MSTLKATTNTPDVTTDGNRERRDNCISDSGNRSKRFKKIQTGMEEDSLSFEDNRMNSRDFENTESSEDDTDDDDILHDECIRV